MQQINDNDFKKEVLESDQPVLVDFFATWCGPCKQMFPVMEELSSEFSGKIKIVKMDINDASQTSAMFNIRSLPTIILFKNGKLTDKRLGAQSKEAISSWLKQHLNEPLRSKCPAKTLLPFKFFRKNISRENV